MSEPLYSADYETLALNEIRAALKTSNYPLAMRAAEAALAQGVRHPLAYKLRALKRDEEGRHEEALEDFHAAAAANPEDFSAHNAIGLSLAKLDRMEEAYAAFDQALALAPGDEAVIYGKGWAYEQAGDFDRARAAYKAVLARNPDSLDARAGLAWTAARRGDWADARAAAEPALARDPRQPKASISLAMAETGEGAAEAAEARLIALLGSGRLAPQERATASKALGDAREALGRYGEAFQAYDAGNRALRRLCMPRFSGGGAVTGSDLVKGVEAYLAGAPALAWREAPRHDSAAAPELLGHVFVLGFARSGTTLLGQMLAAHPLVAEIDESDTLDDAKGRFMSPPSKLGRLLEAGAEELEAAREAYWRRALEVAGPLDGKLLVDKLPMNTLKLPLIARLFPQARLIFVRRDPRDVVLSCFKQSFAVNSVNWEFLGLESAARFYDQVMRLAEAWFERLGLEPRFLRYEDLADQPEAELRGLCADLGLQFDPAMLDVAATAASRAIATPSAAQLAHGLYSGEGQWRNYEAELTPVMPHLWTWIERFGYPVI